MVVESYSCMSAGWECFGSSSDSDGDDTAEAPSHSTAAAIAAAAAEQALFLALLRCRTSRKAPCPDCVLVHGAEATACAGAAAPTAPLACPIDTSGDSAKPMAKLVPS